MSVLDAGLVVPLVRDVEPSCAIAVRSDDYAAWWSASADGSVVVRGVAGPGDPSPQAECYLDDPPGVVFSYWQRPIGSGQGITGCVLRGQAIGTLNAADFGRFQRFVVEFGPAYTDPGPLIEGTQIDPVADVMLRLMITGELGRDPDPRNGSAIPTHWSNGYAPCSFFYTGVLGPHRDTTAAAMDFCDAERHVGQLVASSRSLIPDGAVITDIGPTEIATWQAPDGAWVIAWVESTQHGFLSVRAADADVPLEALGVVLAASPLWHHGDIPPLAP